MYVYVYIDIDEIYIILIIFFKFRGFGEMRVGSKFIIEIKRFGELVWLVGSLIVRFYNKFWDIYLELIDGCGCVDG